MTSVSNVGFLLSLKKLETKMRKSFEKDVYPHVNSGFDTNKSQIFGKMLLVKYVLNNFKWCYGDQLPKTVQNVIIENFDSEA